MGYLGHGNICYVIWINALLYKVHGICVPIVRSIGTKLMKTRCVIRHGGLIFLIGISIRNLPDLRFKSYYSNSGFHVFGDLDLDL